MVRLPVSDILCVNALADPAAQNGGGRGLGWQKHENYMAVLAAIFFMTYFYRTGMGFNLISVRCLPRHTLVSHSEENSGGSKGGTRDAHPRSQNSFNFMQFLGKLGKIICWHPQGLVPPPRGNPGSAIAQESTAHMSSISININQYQYQYQ